MNFGCVSTFQESFHVFVEEKEYCMATDSCLRDSKSGGEQCELNKCFGMIANNHSLVQLMHVKFKLETMEKNA